MSGCLRRESGGLGRFLASPFSFATITGPSMDPSLDNTNNGAYPSLPANNPSSAMPQSPNTLAMSLLNNLMQIQGLENNIVQQQLTNPGQGTPATISNSNGGSQAFNNSNTPNSTLLLEQQIKLSQLQQLQQLQNQIFQQQIALISGQSPSILPSSPTTQTSPGDYTGLPTPGPSGEIRPQRLSMDFLSSSAMSSFMEPLPRAHIPLSPPTTSTSPSHPQDQMNSSSTSNSHNQHSPNPNMIHHLNVTPSSNTHTHTRQGSGGATLSLQRQLQALSTSPQHLYLQQQQNSPSYLHHHHQTSFPQSHRQSSSATSGNPTSTSSPVYHPISPMQHPVSPMFHGIGGMSSPNPNPNTSNPKMNVNQSPNPNLFGSQGQSHSHRSSLSSSSAQQQQYQQSQNPRGHPSSSSMSMTTPHSAPESLAFQIYTGPIPGGGGNGIPGLTLGPSGVPLDNIDMGPSMGSARRMSLSSSPRHTEGQGYPAMSNHYNHAHGHNHGQNLQMPVQMQILDQDISPLTSPWLGAHPTGSSSGSASSAGSKGAIHRSSGSFSLSGAGAGSKRTASGSGDEGGSARKKQSPAIRPTLQMSVINAGGGLGSGRFDRDRENGSTSPLTLAAGGKPGNSPPQKEGDPRSGSGGGEGDKDGDIAKQNKRSSRSGSGTTSGSASGSVSPDPERDSTPAKHSRRMSSSKDNQAAAGIRRPYRGSKSTNSTPLLKSTPTTGSGMTSLGMAGMSMTPMMKAMNAKAVSRSRSKSKSGGVVSAGGSGMLGPSGDPVHDTPSPVDLNHGGDDSLDSRSMPPPPLPASVSSGGNPSGSGSHINMEVDMNINMGASRMMSVGEGNRERVGMSFGGIMPDLGDGMNMNMNNEMGMNMGVPMGMGGDMSGDMGIGNMHGMSGMQGMGGMAMDMAGMNGMNMDMDMGMGMGGMDMNAFGSMGVGGMDMGDIDFGQLSQSDQQQQGQGRGDHLHATSSTSNLSSSQLHQNDQQHNQQESDQQQPLVPVTPASIMNLGRLGINGAPGGSTRLGSASASTSSLANSAGPVSGTGASSSVSSTRQPKAKKDSTAVTTTTRSGRVSTRRSAASSALASGTGVGISPNLKPLLPAGTLTPNLDPTLPSPISPSVSGTSRTIPMHGALSGSSTGGTGSGSGPTVHVRKTSHKAAEQKRRDSLKTTFDDLRKLLPPIALPNDADADPNAITSPLFHATTPLLPGALPPRGPPKAGGEGPNKGVSKLQLLICGNEYIRLLKGRVDRRDEEIEKLRREVGRLRLVAEADESSAGEAGELDLDKDLDAVEKTAMSSRNGGGPNGVINEGTAAGDDMMDEGDDEGDD